MKNIAISGMIKNGIVFSFILSLLSCTPHYNKYTLHTAKYDPKEVCEILNKKRVVKPRDIWLSKFKRLSSKKNVPAQSTIAAVEVIAPKSITKVENLDFENDQSFKIPKFTKYDRQYYNMIETRSTLPVQQSAQQTTDSDKAELIEASKRRIKNVHYYQLVKDYETPIAIGLAGAIALGLSRIFKRKIYKISKWASKNKFKSQGLLVAIHGTSIMGVIKAGNMLHLAGFETPDSVLYASATVFTGAMVYPFIRGKIAPGIQKISRTTKLGLIIACFVSGNGMLLHNANNYSFAISAPNSSHQIQANNIPFIDVSYVKYQELSHSNVQDENETGPWGKAYLVILVLLAIFILGLAVAALACSLACAGAEVAFWIILALGWSGLLVLSVFWIRNIFKGKTKINQRASLSAT